MKLPATPEVLARLAARLLLADTLWRTWADLTPRDTRAVLAATSRRGAVWTETGGMPCSGVCLAACLSSCPILYAHCGGIGEAT